MPRREILTSSDRMQLLAFPEDEAELIRRYTLTKADLAFVRQHRGDHNRLGLADVCGLAAIQTGAGGRTVPAVATQLPNDGYSRGQVSALYVNDPDPFFRASVEKTSRVLIAHEDTLSFGYGAEIAARIADELFARLDAPVRRVAALDTWVGYHPQLEAAILPQTETVVAEIERLLAW